METNVLYGDKIYQDSLFLMPGKLGLYHDSTEVNILRRLKSL